MIRFARNSLPVAFIAVLLCAPAWGNESKWNVLVLIADDLRNELGCYGSKEAVTPHLDRLAGQAVVFDRAYCQQAVCWPSRNSFFSGLRPEHLKKTNATATFRASAPHQVSLPEYFKAHGWFTTGLGKILHNGQDDPQSWSEPLYEPPPLHYAAPENRGKHPVINRSVPENRVNPLFEAAEVDDEAYEDGLIARGTISTLRRLAKDGKPFLLMSGFHKPHTPFNAPKRYWDLYDADTISLPGNPFPPKGAPEKYALWNWDYVRSFADMPESGPMPDELARKIRHAYLACVSYVDAQMGRVLEALGELGLSQKTIVVVTSDHGYQLGEHGLWSKHTNFELAARVPLLVSVPGLSAGRSDALIELIDLYPTLAELCGLPRPETEGLSFAGALKDPASMHRDSAMSIYPRNGARGWSIRTPDVRYTEWHDLKTDELRATELYDHRTDPDENVNCAGEPGRAEQVRALSAQLMQRRGGNPH